MCESDQKSPSVVWFLHLLKAVQCVENLFSHLLSEALHLGLGRWPFHKSQLTEIQYHYSLILSAGSASSIQHDLGCEMITLTIVPVTMSTNKKKIINNGTVVMQTPTCLTQLKVVQEKTGL